MNVRLAFHTPDLDVGVDVYRRAASVAARRRNHETAAFCEDPRTLATGPAEPYSAKAWDAICSAYRYLAMTRTATAPHLRATFLSCAAKSRRAAALYRSADAKLRALPNA